MNDGAAERIAELFAILRGKKEESKALEAFHDLYFTHVCNSLIANGKKDNSEVKKDREIVEKELRAMAIIRDKNVDTAYIKRTSFFDYNSSCLSEEKLHKEEYDLVREALQCDTSNE